MSTRIAIFFSGELEQVATPMELYQNPISLRVADFIGNPKINIIHAHATKENNALRISSDLGTFVASPDLLTDDVPDADTFDCFLGIRPEKIKILAAPAAGSITASVYSVQPAGSETIVNLKINDTNILVKDLDIKNYKTDFERLF